MKPGEGECQASPVCEFVHHELMSVLGVDEVSAGMLQEEIGYRSFLLRLWCAKHNGKYTWRASLENPRTGQQDFFSNFEALIKYLCQLSQDLESEMDK